MVATRAVCASILSFWFLAGPSFAQEDNRLLAAIADLSSKPQHHAMAQSSFTGDHNWVWSRDSREQAEADALAACRQAEAAQLRSGCRIVYVNGRETGRAVFDIDFPAEIIIFDGVSGTSTVRSGAVHIRDYYTPMPTFIVRAGSRQVCSGVMSRSRSPFGGQRLDVESNCFGFSGAAGFEFGRRSWRVDFGSSHVEVRRAF